MNCRDRFCIKTHAVEFIFQKSHNVDFDIEFHTKRPVVRTFKSAFTRNAMSLDLLFENPHKNMHACKFCNLGLGLGLKANFCIHFSVSQPTFVAIDFEFHTNCPEV